MGGYADRWVGECGKRECADRHRHQENGPNRTSRNAVRRPPAATPSPPVHLRSPFQFTVRLTVVWALVELAVLLGERPFWSTPVRVTVYVFLGVTRPLLLFEVVVVALQDGKTSKLPARAMSNMSPNNIFLRAPLVPAPASASAGTANQKAKTILGEKLLA